MTPFSAHHWPGGRSARRGRPSDGRSCSGIGGSGGSSAPAATSASRSVASFSSAMPIGPTRCALRNWRTTGSVLDSSISRGPNMARWPW